MPFIKGDSFNKSHPVLLVLRSWYLNRDRHSTRDQVNPLLLQPTASNRKSKCIAAGTLFPPQKYNAFQFLFSEHMNCQQVCLRYFERAVFTFSKYHILMRLQRVFLFYTHQGATLKQPWKASVCHSSTLEMFLIVQRLLTRSFITLIFGSSCVSLTTIKNIQTPLRFYPI